MPILRGFTGDIRTMPPDIYVNEMPVPQADNFEIPDFVLGFVGDFDRGPLNEYIYANETPTKRLSEVVRTVFGAMSDTGSYGNQLLTHLHNARAKKAVFVRVLGADYATASLTLTDLEETPQPILRISAKYPGTYGNIFTVEVLEGAEPEQFTLKLHSDLDGFETYQDLCMDKENDNYVVKVINSKSLHFVAEELENVETNFKKKRPSALETTQLAGGSNGSPLTATDYIGAFDTGTGQRTGLKLLELAGKQITDFAYVNFSSSAADKSLYFMAEKYNSLAYCGTNHLSFGETGEEVIAYRKTFDTDFMQMVAGSYKANTGAVISGACLSAIIHTIGHVEDSGLAQECTWINSGIEEYDFDQLSALYKNQIGCFTLKPSETGNGVLGWRMGNDYTLAVKDVAGEIITDNENRKVNKRRLNSWIENSLFYVAAKWQGKAFTAKMKRDAEIRIRTFFDELKNPTINPLDNPKIEEYSITFDDTAMSIDVFVQNIVVKHFNTAEWILLNYQGGTNVEVAK